MTRVKQDYYEVLGLTRTADEEQIRRAFRSLARELHPDVSDAPEAEGGWGGVAGRILAQACPECQGTGTVTRRRVVKVRIPPGVEDGTRLRVMGEPEEDHLLVRVNPGPRDSSLIRWAATALLACAVGLLVYFILFGAWVPASVAVPTSLSVGACSSGQLLLRTQSQGVATNAWLGVLMRNRGLACRLTGLISVSVRRRGRPVRVKGRNPIDIPLRSIVRPGRFRLVAVAYWWNWCGGHTELDYVATYAGRELRHRFATIPPCIDPSQPSTLTGVSESPYPK